MNSMIRWVFIGVGNWHGRVLAAGLGLLNGVVVAQDSAVDSGDPVPSAYRIDSLPTPSGIDPQVGALGVLPDGRLIAAFHRGEVCFYDFPTATWTVFARGLHEPLGLLPRGDGDVLVMQRPELTRLRDVDGDGVADEYKTEWDGFGLSGNYHEFAYGPVADADGRLFVALNLASTGDTVREEIRGPWAPHGPGHREFLDDWDQTKRRLSKMYSRVAWRGWVMQIDASAPGRAVPWSHGWRSPDGLGFDAAGRLLVTDNQGDWVGTSGLWVSRRGTFAGHPASRVWEAGAAEDPDMHDPKAHAARRTPPSVLFPHGMMASSPTQPLCDVTGGRFGPFQGQIFVGEMNTPRLLRVLLEEVDGVIQGACTPFLDWAGLRAGNHRLAWMPDGSLIVGQTHLAWAGGAGLQRVTWTGHLPMAVAGIGLQPGGFLLRFTQPVAAPPGREAWSIQRYRYEYHSAYGSPQMDRSPVVPSEVEWRDGGRAVWIGLSEVFGGGTVYEFTLPALRSESGVPLDHRLLCYTINAVPSR